MRAAVLHGPDDVRLTDRPDPVPAAGEVVVRIEVALLGGTVRKMVRRGGHARMGRPPLPLGHEGAGVVEAVGEGVTRVRVGDRVVPANSAPCFACPRCERGLTAQCDSMTWCTGFLADRLLVPAAVVEHNLHALPDGLDFETGALAENLACVLKGRDRTPVRRGERAVVVGTGPMGLLWVRWLRAAGAHVTAVGGAERMERARRFGAHAVEEGLAFAERVRQAPAEAEVIIEAAGTPTSWETALAAAGPGARVQLFGGPPSGTRAALDTDRMHYGELTLVSSFHHTPTHFAEAVRLLGQGFVEASEILEGEIPWSDLPAVLRRAGPGKWAVRPVEEAR